MTPTTLTQLAILVCFVIPGIVYQAVRARLAGEVPQNRDTTNKVLRALAASAVLVSVYAIILGPTVVRAATKASTTESWITQHVRGLGVSALVLLFGIPALAAVLAARRWYLGGRISGMQGRGVLGPGTRCGRSRLGREANRLLRWLGSRARGRRGVRYDPTPTAWDWAVDHGASGAGFVRVLGKDGRWKGGGFGTASYFTAFPEPPAVFVEQAWQLDEAGRFVAPQQASRGAWIPCTDAVAVEFVAA